MTHKCKLCGKEAPESAMKSISYGRKTEWWCWECYKVSQQEAATSDIYRRSRFEKMKAGKK